MTATIVEPSPVRKPQPTLPARLALGWATGTVLVWTAAMILTQLFQNADLYPVARRLWGNDFRLFYRAAERVLAGQSPYLDHYFTSPPTAAWAFTPFAHLPRPAAISVFFGLTTIFCFGSFWLLTRYFQDRDPVLRTAVRWGGAAIMLLGFPFQFLVERGNTDGLMLIAVLGALLALPKREWLSGVILGAAASIKIYPLLLLVALAAFRRWRAVAVGAVVIAALVGATFMDWPGFIERFASRDQGFRIDENVSLANTMFYLGVLITPDGPMVHFEVATLLGKIAFLLLLGTHLWLDWRRPLPSDPRDFAAHLLLYAPLMVSFPNLVHNYELVFAVAALPACLRLLPGAGDPVGRIAALLYGFGLGLSQFQSIAFHRLSGAGAVHAVPGIGLVLMIGSVLLIKARWPWTATVPASQPVVLEPSLKPSAASFAILRRPLPLTLLLTLLGALGLQVWRPFFHLTDDNLTAWLPFITDLAQRFWHGQPLTVIDAIFGGDYHWLNDAGSMGFLGPYSVALSWMLITPLAPLYCDVICTLDLLTIAGAFAWSALWLRRRLNLTVSDGWIVFLSLSYTFTPFNFVVGSSWLGFINPQASAPFMLVGLLHPRWRRGVALVAGGALYAMFGGHFHPFVFLSTLMGVLALAVAWEEKTARPLFVFAGGLLAALLVALPFLVPAASGFSQSHRAEALPPDLAAMFNVSLPRLLLSFATGPVSVLGPAPQPIHYLDPMFLSVLAFTLANGLVLAVLATKRRWGRLEIGLVLCAALAVLLIVRPAWLAQLFSALPVYRSLRWPFREIAQLTFFAHVLLLLNLERLHVRTARLIGVTSALLFATVFVNPPPTFNAMELDRRLLLTGTSQEFWKQYIAARGSRPTIIVSGHPMQVIGDHTNIPFSLLSAFDYSCLFGSTNVSGYSPTIPPTKFSSDIRPWHHSGIFTRGDADRLVAQHPELVHVALRNTKPPVFSIIDGGRERSFMLDLHSLKISPVRVTETK